MLSKIMAGIVVGLAVLFWFGPAISGDTSTGEYEDALVDVLVDDTLNNTRTEGAPQQQVVNGWTNRDLLTVQVRQTNELIDAQYRQTALLAVALIALAWLVFNRQAHSPRDATTDAPASKIPDQKEGSVAAPAPSPSTDWVADSEQEDGHP